MRREAVGIYNVWLIDHGYLLPTEREIRRQTIRALRHQEQVVLEAVRAATDEALRGAWPRRLLEPAPDNEQTRLEWLWTPPTSKQASELDDHLAKVKFLRELGRRSPEDRGPAIGDHRRQWLGPSTTARHDQDEMRPVHLVVLLSGWH